MGRTLFSSMKRKMFSKTTMASSMTMPTASASARREMVFSVNPISHMSRKVPMMEVGMARAAMMVARTWPRNSKTTSAARIDPSTRCSLTAPTLVRVVSVLSRMTSSL